MFENIQLAFQGVFGHKLRSFLTMLGIIIGIASIITIISTIKGTNEQIKQNLIGSGSNIVNVQLYQNDWAVDMSYQTPDGIRVLQDEQRDEMIALDGVADVTLYRSRENVEGFYYRNTGFSGKLYGVDDHYFSVYGYEVRSGRGFTARDFASASKNVILDEADEMLNMGFTDSINEILAAIPENRNMLLFSATMPKEIASITKKYMKDPKEIVIGRKNEGNKNIRDIYYMVRAQDKYLALKRLADYYPNIYGIIFCRTRKETQEIADKLIQDGYNADSLHGELSQAQRDYVMQKFRIKNIQLLVATDVAARGLDVDDLTHVINYGLPDEVESYTHRRGRTGRAGKTGIAISICHVREKGKIREIERIINKKFDKGEMPTGEQICEKQLFNLVDQIEKVKVNEEEIASLMPSIYRKLEWLDKEDIIKRVGSLEFNRMIDYYKDNDDIEVVDENAPRERGKRGGRGEAEEGYTRFFINFGKTDELTPPQLIELVNKCVPGKVRIGRIDLRDNFSFFEVEEGEANRVMDSMNGFEVDGRRISVEPAQAKGEGGKGSRGGNGFRDRRDSGRGGRDSRRESDRGGRRSSRSDDKPKRKFYDDAPRSRKKRK